MCFRCSISAVFLFLPAFIALVYNGGVGANPRDLPVAVVNRESNCSAWMGTSHVDCGAPADLSCIFLDRMNAQSLLPVGDRPCRGGQAIARP